MGRRAALATAAAALAVAIATPAQAATEFVGQSFPSSGPCTDQWMYNRYQSVGGAELNLFGHRLGPGAGGMPITFYVYEGASATGPYDLVWSGSGTTITSAYQWSAPINLNLEPGFWYLLGVFVDSASVYAADCYVSTSPALALDNVSWGFVNNASQGGGPPSDPFTPAVSTMVHMQGIDTGPLVYPPTAALDGPYITDEANPSVVLDASGSTDSDGSIIDYGYDCDYDEASPSFGGSGTTHTCSYFADDDTYDVAVQVMDDDWATNRAFSTVTITNLDPEAAGSCDPVTCAADEGGSLDFVCEGTDPGAVDNVNLTFYWDLGSGFVLGAEQTGSFADDGLYIVTCQADDGDGGTDEDQVEVLISNVDPVIDTFGGPAGSLEGDVLSFNASATDAGVDDVLTYTWDWGDGTPTGSGATPDHAFGDEGTYVVELTVADGDGGSAPDSMSVLVQNVAPVLSGACPATSLTEGDVVSESYGVVDPGDDAVVVSITGGVASMNVSGGPTSWTLDWTVGFDDVPSSPLAYDVLADDGDGGIDAIPCTATLVYLDADGDGMPDTWELANGLDPTDADDATEDTDGDGVGNLEEWLAGTDPQAAGTPSEAIPVDPGGGDLLTGPVDELAWVNAIDPDGDPLTYDVELYDADSGALLEEHLDVLEDASGTSAVELDSPLSEGLFEWRVQARDPFGYGPCSDYAEF